MVFRGEWRDMPVAIKQSMVTDSADFQAEVELMKALRPHQNVVQTYGVFLDADAHATIVMEYLAGGSLDQALKDSSRHFSDEQMLSLVKGIAAGMHHLHRENIVSGAIGGGVFPPVPVLTFCPSFPAGAS